MRSICLFVFCCHPNICLKSPFIVHPMKQSLLGPLRLLPICVIAASCSKSASHSDVASNGTIAPTATFTTDVKKSPFYGDTILYVQGDQPSAYQFAPTNSLGTGTYVAWPAGVTIDPKTGIIDASKSEPGSRYNVGFVSATTGDTAYNQVIVDGVTYADGVYALDSKDSVLSPYYNMSAATPWAADSKEAAFLGARSRGSHFDAPVAGVLSANEQGLAVSATDGSINLANSVRQGLFGSNPQNGDTKEIPIYYRLGDASRHSLLKSTVIVHYYNTLADVPAVLLASCQASQQAFAGQGAVLSTESDAVETAATGTTPTSAAKAVAAPAAAPVTPRPPQVVLVVKGH
jgi:hypothetical protein